MRQFFKELFKDYGKYVFGSLLLIIGGFYLYLDRPSVHSKSDVSRIQGTLKEIEQVLVYSKKINKTESDSTYHIYLNEFPCKFQVSYSYFDSKEFYRKTQVGDSITFHIARQDIEDINRQNFKIRSFSLKVNSKTYLSLESGLFGFGKGIFELGMIILPLTLLIILSLKTMKKNNWP